MKKLISLILIVGMMAMLCACSSNSSNQEESTTEAVSEISETEETTSVAEEETEPEELAEYDVRTLGEEWVYSDKIVLGSGSKYVDIPYYALEDVVYCTDPVNEEYQSFNIYVPACYMTDTDDGAQIDPEGVFETKAEDGNSISIGSSEAPIIYLNTISGYAAGTAPKIGDSRMGRNAGYMYQFLEQGCVLVTVSSRGSSSTDADGNCDGYVPAGLVDLKAGLRWLSYNDKYLAGDSNRIVTVGVSAGGGMSALMGSSGNSALFDTYLEEIGAVPGSDAVWASVCYCPITNLEFADGCAWWQYGADEGDSFDAAVSQKIYDLYVDYVQSLGFDLGDDGVSGKFYEGFKEAFEAALNYHVENDLGNDEAAALAFVQEKDPEGSWLSYSSADGISITSVGDYCRKYWGTTLKGIATFDTPGLDSMEAKVFNGKHFSWLMLDAFEELSDNYEEAKTYAESYRKDIEDDGVGEIAALYDPMTFIGSGLTKVASNWRFQIGSEDNNITQAGAWLLYNMLNEMEDVDNINYDILYGIGHQTVEYDPYDLITWVYNCAFDSTPGYDNLEELNDVEVTGEVDGEIQSFDTVAGTYTLSETNAAGMNINWTLALDADGNYVLSEEGVMARSYTGRYCVVDGFVSCGPINEEEGPRGDAFGEGYISVWKVDQTSGTCEHADLSKYVNPDAVSGGAAEEAALGDVTGSYTLNETNAAGMNITWTLSLQEDNTYILNETGIVDKSYTGNYTVNGQYVCCGPINEEEGPRGEAFGEGYISVWTLDGNGGCAHADLSKYSAP